jgi:hypothetical protein
MDRRGPLVLEPVKKLSGQSRRSCAGWVCTTFFYRLLEIRGGQTMCTKREGEFTTMMQETPTEGIGLFFTCFSPAPSRAPPLEFFQFGIFPTPWCYDGMEAKVSGVNPQKWPFQSLCGSSSFSHHRRLLTFSIEKRVIQACPACLINSNSLRAMVLHPNGSGVHRAARTPRHRL